MYAERCASLGLRLRVVLADGTEHEGTGTRIDADGRLVLATAYGEITVGSGDVAHVRAD